LTRENVTDDGFQFTQGKSGNAAGVEVRRPPRRSSTRAKALPERPDRFVLRTQHGEEIHGNGFRANWQR